MVSSIRHNSLKGVSQPVQYGENLQALMAYLVNYQLIPLASRRVYQRSHGPNISQGTFVNTNKCLEKNLEGFENAVIDQLIGADVAHFDETGMRCEKRTKWVHSASTDKLTYYAIHDKRVQVPLRILEYFRSFRARQYTTTGNPIIPTLIAPMPNAMPII